MHRWTVMSLPDDSRRSIEFITEHQEQPFFLYFPQAMPGSTAAPLPVKRFVAEVGTVRGVMRLKNWIGQRVGSWIG